MQESLTNVARHAGVAGVTVRVWADAGTLHAKIEDRGAVSIGGRLEGRPVERPRWHEGTDCAARRSHHYRVFPGVGTTIVADLPLGKTTTT